MTTSLTRHHGIAVDEAQLRHEFGHRPFAVETILLAAKGLGMTARLVKQAPERLERSPLPAIGIDTQGNFFIAAKFGYEGGDKSEARMVVQHPGSPPPVCGCRPTQAGWEGSR